MQTFRGTTCLGGKDSGVLSPSAHLQRCDLEQCLSPLWAFSCLWMKPEAPACFSRSSHVLLVLLTVWSGCLCLFPAHAVHGRLGRVWGELS